MMIRILTTLCIFLFILVGLITPTATATAAGDTAAQELLWLGLNGIMTGRVFCIKDFLLLPFGKLT